ncbi:MAG: hypothetical protein ABIK28_15235, partial [Planctomycetota bacterium]
MRTFFTLCLCLAFSLAAFADTLHVPSLSYSTIQDAIDAAMPGDVVMVCPGTYVENISFLGKAITVVSSHGPACTVIDGSQPLNPDFGSVVMFLNHEGLDSVLDGFTLTNGTGTYVVGYPSYNYCGGGIVCWMASPCIKNCRFFKNTAREGGGLYGDHCESLIINCIFEENHATDNGGGMYC